MQFITGSIFTIQTLIPWSNSGDVQFFILDASGNFLSSGEILNYSSNYNGYYSALTKFTAPSQTGNYFIECISPVGRDYLEFQTVSEFKMPDIDFTPVLTILSGLYDLEYHRLSYLRQIQYGGLIPDITDIKCFKNDLFEVQFTITDSEGAPIDLTDWDVYIASYLFSGNRVQCEKVNPVSGLVKATFIPTKDGRWPAQCVLIKDVSGNTIKKTISEFEIWVYEDYWAKESSEVLPFDEEG